MAHRVGTKNDKDHLNHMKNKHARPNFLSCALLIYNMTTATALETLST